MNLLVISYILFAFICFESAITVYRLNRKARLNRLYAAFSFSFVVYSAIMIQLFISANEAECWVWWRMSAILACINSILAVLYFIELTGVRPSRLILRMLYTLPALFFLPSITFTPVITGFIKYPWGYDMVLRDNGWARVFFSYFTACFIASAALAVRWLFKAGTEREKKQAKVIVISGIIAVAGVLHLNLFVSHSSAAQTMMLHFYNIISFCVFVFGIRYAIIKYKLMIMSNESPASELFSGMHDAMFIMNTHGDIIIMNENARLLMQNCRQSSLTGQVFSLFSLGNTLKQEFNDLIHGHESNHTSALVLDVKGDANVMDVSLLGIKNEIGESIGAMVIVRGKKDLRDLNERYGLSRREVETILLLSNGLSAHEISQECDISLPTARTHIHNIYRKTGLKNRVELVNLLNKHT